MPLLAFVPWVVGFAAGVSATLWFSDRLKWLAVIAAAGVVGWYLIAKRKP